MNFGEYLRDKKKSSDRESIYVSSGHFGSGLTVNGNLRHVQGTINAAGLTMDGVALTTVQSSSESFSDNDTSLMTSAAIQDKILSYSYITGSGNAATATALETARTIGGVSFNGTANINLPGVNTGGNQATSGNAATATALATARTINGVSFDGTADVTGNTSITGSLTVTSTDDDALQITSSTNKTPDANWSGQFTIASGSPSSYKGGIAIDSTAMWVGHNSGARDLYLATNETARLKIAADGEITQPNIPAFRAANEAGGGGYLHNGSSAGAGVIVFGSDSGTGLYDNGNNYNTSDGLFTAPVDGYYLFSITFFKYTSYDNDNNTYWGFNSSNGQMISNHGLKGYDGGGTVTAIFYLDANDTCSGYCFSALDMYTWRTQNYNSFQGILIG